MMDDIEGYKGLTREAGVAMLKAFGGARSRPKKSDIGCPECETLMVYPEPNVIHNNPPRKRVKCLSCRYKGWVDVEPPGPAIDITEGLTMTTEASHTKPKD